MPMTKLGGPSESRMLSRSSEWDDGGGRSQSLPSFQSAASDPQDGMGLRQVVSTSEYT